MDLRGLWCDVADCISSNRRLVPVESAQAATLFVVGGVLLALMVELAIAPRIVARENLALWHRLGTGLFVVQWICALVVLRQMVSALSSSSDTPDAQA